MPKKRPTINKTSNPPSIGTPTGPGGPGGGGGGVCAAHTKLINTNKIEANIFLFCII